MKKFYRKQTRRIERKNRLMTSRPLAILLLLIVAAVLYYRPGFSPGQPIEKAREATLPEEIFGLVSKVADGDSIEVKTSGRTLKIRLYGIDAPELNQPRGPEAHNWLADRIMNKKVKVKRMDIDKYNRLVGLVFLDDVVLSQALVAAGQAWVYPQYCSIGLCRQMKKDEKEARCQNLGLWRDSDPTPPWIWRRSKPSGKAKRPARSTTPINKESRKAPRAS